MEIFQIKNKLLDGGSCTLYTNIGIIENKNQIGNPISNGFYINGDKISGEILESVIQAKIIFEEKSAEKELEKAIQQFNFIYKGKATASKI